MKHYVIGYYDPREEAWPIIRMEDGKQTVIAFSCPLEEAMDLVYRLNDTVLA